MERPRRRWLRLAVEAGVVVLALLAISRWQTRGLIAEGERLPPLELRSLDGRLVNLSSLAGRPTLVHVWATWCGVCRAEIPSLNALARDLPDGSLLVTIVSDGDDLERIRDYIKQHDIRYEVLLGNDAVTEQLHVRSFPTNYFVDERGLVRAKTVGLSTYLSYRARLGCVR